MFENGSRREIVVVSDVAAWKVSHGWGSPRCVQSCAAHDTEPDSTSESKPTESAGDFYSRILTGKK